jgi:hypothetical protein
MQASLIFKLALLQFNSANILMFIALVFQYPNTKKSFMSDLNFYQLLAAVNQKPQCNSVEASIKMLSELTAKNYEKQAKSKRKKNK